VNMAIGCTGITFVPTGSVLLALNSGNSRRSGVSEGQVKVTWGIKKWHSLFL
jgi:hypothetical protein